jgi:uncharacterized protein (TIGR02145 family)
LTTRFICFNIFLNNIFLIKISLRKNLKIINLKQRLMKTKNRIWIFNLIVMGLVLILNNSCKKQKDQGQPPVLETVIVSSITTNTAKISGNITNDGGATITARGVCWSTVQNPTIADTKTTDGTGAGTFTSAITGLTATTIYYVKAYATNNAGTSYGNELLFKTFTGTVLDIDGNVYNTITIGTQTWMAENLKTTKYINGDILGTTNPSTLDISGESSPKYQWVYDANAQTYGRLYTWYAVTDSRSVCPAGWHLPADAEWTTLIDYLGGASLAGDKLKEAGNSHWLSPNTATDETGFTDLPGGVRLTGLMADQHGTFFEMGSTGDMWSSTDSFPESTNILGITADGRVFVSNFPKNWGFAVRCLKD